MMKSLILAAAASLGLAGAAAADTAPDGPVTTKPATAPAVPSAANDATVQQIDAWTRAGAEEDAAEAAAAGADARKVHGTVTAGVGTGGYREISATAQGKIGGADVAIAVSKVDGGRGRYRGY